MDPEQLEHSEPKPGEAPEAFVARVRLSRRVLPALREIAAQRIALVVESDRHTSNIVSLASDFILELGDTRLRLILVPGDSDPFESGAVSREALAHYMLDIPDTDAVAVLADNDQLLTWVFDVYSLQSDEMVRPASLSEALSTYFESAVHPIDIPNLRGALTLPSINQLEIRLVDKADEALQSIKTSRARIDEKIAALKLIDSADRDRLVDMLKQALRGNAAPLSLILVEEDENDDN